jgi:hypothetical protein
MVFLFIVIPSSHYKVKLRAIIILLLNITIVHVNFGGESIFNASSTN